MFGIESLPGLTRAVATVGLVLVEAVLLYVGYGVMTAIAGRRINEAIRR